MPALDRMVDDPHRFEARQQLDQVREQNIEHDRGKPWKHHGRKLAAGGTFRKVVDQFEEGFKQIADPAGYEVRVLAAGHGAICQVCDQADQENRHKQGGKRIDKRQLPNHRKMQPSDALPQQIFRLHRDLGLHGDEDAANDEAHDHEPEQHPSTPWPALFSFQGSLHLCALPWTRVVLFSQPREGAPRHNQHAHYRKRNARQQQHKREERLCMEIRIKPQPRQNGCDDYHQRQTSDLANQHDQKCPDDFAPTRV